MKKYIFISIVAITSCLFAEPTTEEIIEACHDRNHAFSCEMLGNMYYYEGTEFKQDINKAVKYYKKACSLGISGSCYSLGKIEERFARNHNSSKSLEAAIKYYVRGCKVGNNDSPVEPKSCTSAARLIKTRRQFQNPGVIAGIDDNDHKDALQLYMLACKHYDKRSCQKIEQEVFLYKRRIQTRSKSIGSIAGGEYGINKSAAEESIRAQCNKYAEYDSKYFNPYHNAESTREYFDNCMSIATGVYNGNYN